MCYLNKPTNTGCGTEGVPRVS